MSKRSRLSAREKRAQQEARRQKQRRIYYAAAIVGAIAVIALFAVIRQLNAPSLEDVVLPESLEVPANADGKAWGPEDAPVVIEEFSDFQ